MCMPYHFINNKPIYFFLFHCCLIVLHRSPYMLFTFNNFHTATISHQLHNIRTILRTKNYPTWFCVSNLCGNMLVPVTSHNDFTRNLRIMTSKYLNYRMMAEPFRACWIMYCYYSTFRHIKRSITVVCCLLCQKYFQKDGEECTLPSVVKMANQGTDKLLLPRKLRAYK